MPQLIHNADFVVILKTSHSQSHFHTTPDAGTTEYFMRPFIVPQAGHSNSGTPTGATATHSVLHAAQTASPDM